MAKKINAGVVRLDHRAEQSLYLDIPKVCRKGLVRLWLEPINRRASRKRRGKAVREDGR